MTKQFDTSKIKQGAKQLDVPIVYDDGSETEFMTIKAPKVREILEIRKLLASYVKDNTPADTRKIDDVMTMGAIDYLASLCLMACVKAYHGEQDENINKSTAEDWLAFIYETGGSFSDMALTAAKLCGFHDVAKAGKGVQNKIDELKLEFDAETDNPPV